jgi:flagellar P-ring protein FlgI
MLAPVVLLALALLAPAVQAQTRIKDLVSYQGVRPNQLYGYGLVVGLNGTGDSLRSAPFTNQSIQSMLDRLGVNVRNGNARTRNVAAVIVTAELPAFAGTGSRIDVTVSSLGDSTSLAGGSLVLTPLSGADNVIYAAAQGQVAIGGFNAAGRNESVTQGVPTAGRIANGALVEREAPSHLECGASIDIELRNPDFNTAVRMADAINEFSRARYNTKVATEKDLRTVTLRCPPKITAARFLADIGELPIVPDAPARVVIDEKTGTVVIGRNVRITTVAVAHGSITVRVTETPKVSQPNPFSKGATVVTSDTEVAVDQPGANVSIVKGTSLEALVAGLNRLGLKPPSVIAILQAIKTAGALQADLVVQ